ncbi:MAG: amine dehydrogenase large subunit [Pseudomonadales bacterium]
MNQSTEATTFSRRCIRRRFAFSLLAALIFAPLGYAEFVPEAMGNVRTLPKIYPDHWLMVHDASFFHMSEGEVVVVDPLAETVGEQYKGMITASLIADYAFSKGRNEHYVAETFYSRGGRGGERTDVVTIYDTENLAVQDEIVIPPKRLSGMPKTIDAALVADDRFLLIYNFTPSQSVSVVDLEQRKFVGEVSTAGCGFVIPTAKRSFSSICADGALLTTHLDKDGQASGSERSNSFFDAETDPVFEAMARVGPMAYFPTFKGQVLPLDLGGKQPRAKKMWWLTEKDQRDWRPGGMNPVATDAENHGYFLMHPEGTEGTHKNGGSEVWVYNLAKQKRLARLPLQNWGLSISTTGSGKQRLLIVTNAEMQVDVYQLPSGDYLRSLAVETATPFLTYGAQ